MGDNAKLLKELTKKEEATGWKKLHEQSSALGMTLKVGIEELMGDLRKLCIKRELEVEESVAAVKQTREDLRKELEELVAQGSIKE
jgi:hypothetical protein